MIGGRSTGATDVSPYVDGTPITAGCAGRPPAAPERQARVRYRRAMRLAPLLVTAVLAAGCTTVVAGTPSAPPGVLLPPRPKEVRLDGVDPCSLLTVEQRAELDLDGAPYYTNSHAELFDGDVPTCTITGYTQRPIALAIGAVTTAGIERWQSGDL